MTMAFPGAVKTFTLSVFDATGALTRVASSSPFVPSILYPFRYQNLLPSARVRTAVDVQHLPGDVTSFRLVNHSIGNVLCFRDHTHG